MPNTRNWLYRKQMRGFVTDTPYKAGTMGIEAENRALSSDDGEAVADTSGYSVDHTYPAEVDTEGPRRQIIRRIPSRLEREIKYASDMIKRIATLLSRVWATAWHLRPWREKSAIEKEHDAEVKARQKMQNVLRNEARLFCRRASNAYARMGICHMPPIHQRSLISGIQKVKFSNVVAERNAIWLQIATDRLPWGVDILRCIHDEGVLTNLSASLRHHVQGKYDVERGAWLCIERGRGVRGIPQSVTYEKMVNLLPTDSHGLTLPFGETVNSKRLYRSLRDFPHLLIAGATGQGKTSFLNVIMACLIERNTPDDVKIVMVDLKNGIEFDQYRGVPHLWRMGGSDKPEEDQIAPDGIVGRSEKVIKLLERLRREGERRLNRFREAQVTNIDEYNRSRSKSRMDRIVVVIDEWARVALGPDGPKADRILAEITATYRAVGFHVILATQIPITRVISTLIKTNFNARLAFGVPHNTASMVIIDSGRAKGLEPVGRAIFQYGTQVVETQVPYIAKNELTAIIAEAKSDGGAVEESVSMLEIFQYALNNLDGSLAGQRLYEHFSDKIGKSALEIKLKSMDELLVDIEGVEYIVCAPFGNVPRRLERHSEAEGIPPNVEAVGQ